ncbi:hypothetical protein IFM89_033355 [Coptis chinensis]|uniref:Glycosyltransferase N-terminal domain-containing protein n=1 Tax=Coptis chinensis TaxID=261450 RepID=A0A835HGY8_9MAGN|nr:hypothetical protein IFM89_033355 [Coptis chinensis]
MAQDQPLHFIMFPLMAQGHMIPAVDMARLFAQRGVVVTIVMTPKNALLFKTTTDRAQQSNLPIRILELRFPNVEVGLPEGCENADTLPSPDSLVNFFIATAMLREPLEKSLQEMEPRPSCIISDFGLPWTNETARKFDIPRLIFHGISCFSLFCSHNILHHKPDETESIISESETFVIPGLPDQIEITKSRLPGASHKSSTDINDIRARINDVELTAYGVVINSFYDLEPLYIDGYQKAKQDKVWCVGPVSQFNKEVLDKFGRGIGVEIGVTDPVPWGGEDNVRVSVSKEDVEKAIYKFTCKDDEGVERRKKTMKFAKLAREAMEEGGSSYLSMTLFINDIREQQLKKTSCQKQNNVDHTCR